MSFRIDDISFSFVNEDDFYHRQQIKIRLKMNTFNILFFKVVL